MLASTTDEYKIDDRWFHQEMGEHASLTPRLRVGTDPEEDRHAAEVSHLKRMITAQNDVIENMRQVAFAVVGHRGSAIDVKIFEIRAPLGAQIHSSDTKSAPQAEKLDSTLSQTHSPRQAIFCDSPDGSKVMLHQYSHRAGTRSRASTFQFRADQHTQITITVSLIPARCARNTQSSSSRTHHPV